MTKTNTVTKVIETVEKIKGVNYTNVPEKGYAEFELPNQLFCIARVQNDYETEISIPSLGGFKAEIANSYVCLFLRMLTK